ncbi:MAG: hypothetical protein CO128_03980 [Ignavibacteriales bacterium CG_4_9_14_3_um_filter_30_11]|nr:MAG: hypothetical protein CO128_03980 [Ignavibacteriales bacterium CG_4_9_14_3_um_filter_30_11]
MVERGITWILESIYEQDFLNCSYGFRPKRNSHQALKKTKWLDNVSTGKPHRRSKHKGIL